MTDVGTGRTRAPASRTGFDQHSSVTRLAPLSASAGALVSSYRNGYALSSERQFRARCRKTDIFQRASSDGTSVLKITRITPDQLKMTNNPPICKIAILGLRRGGRVYRTLRPNHPITGKRASGAAAAVPVSAWQNARRLCFQPRHIRRHTFQSILRHRLGVDAAQQRQQAVKATLSA